MAPAVLVGALVGMAVIGKVPQRLFDIVTLLTSVIAAGALIVL
ncbi:hypothetical protein SAMN02745244_01946 [Tessaracoccus bendigoensis DSM 12906]|uniref:Sulfite exporter TauE/SafE n=1 Tax=Tessaracoccus bendigoensis DSM 12906 TaxID=1123357 RepID=A0A1M6HD02_9ACTN|nr:hypothetical protein [Tessaracoccus bendigoensis]SHJ20097.1 hypothetical protein SAMN02745244_01946 [Tessaracoccus bendigoensis DSM 12906]